VAVLVLELELAPVLELALEPVLGLAPVLELEQHSLPQMVWLSLLPDRQHLPA